MAVTKDKLLSSLKVLSVDVQTYDHPIVMTVEEQAKYIGHLDGGHSKNLFLKDKKNRLYLVSALTTTTIDLKVLSQRLGLGKGGLRMAPEDLMQEVLKVPLGCVTPLALINESARSVALLLDQGFKTKSRVFFHPLSNDATTSMTTGGLDTFLKSIGREPVYVDLEAVVAVGKDQPPDLIVYVPSDSAVVSGQSEEQNAKNASNQIATVMKENVNVGTIATVSKGVQKTASKEKMVESGSPSETNLVADPQRLVMHILDETVAAVVAEVTAEAVEQHGKDVGLIAAVRIKERLAPDLESIIMLFKNASYTQGFVSGVGSHSLSRLS